MQAAATRAPADRSPRSRLSCVVLPVPPILQQVVHSRGVRSTREASRTPGSSTTSPRGTSSARCTRVVARRPARHRAAARAPAGLHRRQAHRAARAAARPGRRARHRRRPRRQDHLPRPRPAGRLPDRHAARPRQGRRLRAPGRGGADPRLRRPRRHHRPGPRPQRRLAARRRPRPERKVAALGIRVSRGVTMHGFALNCDVDLGWYDRFVPVRHRRRRGHLAEPRARPRRHASPRCCRCVERHLRELPRLGAVRRDARLRAAPRARRDGTRGSSCSLPDGAPPGPAPAAGRRPARISRRERPRHRDHRSAQGVPLRRGVRVAVSTSTWPCPPAACTASSGPTARARPRRSGCCSGWPAPAPARCGSSASRCRTGCRGDRPRRARSSRARSSPPTSPAARTSPCSPAPSAPPATGSTRRSRPSA